jgi:ribonuclease/clavin/mitogillin
LIDCGEGQPGYIPLLIQSLKAIHPEAYISDILLSHCHRDHWGGLSDIMASELNGQGHHIQVHKFPLLVDIPFFKNLEGFPKNIFIRDLKDNQIIKVDEQAHIRVVYTPGHTKDHCSFHLEEEDTLFTADCITGYGFVTFQDLTQYIGTLKRIQRLDPARLYPGHGDIVYNCIQKIDQYLSQRMAKEKKILDLMCQNTKQTWTPVELVERISGKKDYGEEIMILVARTIRLHLIKLYHDGKVEMVDTDSFKKIHQADPYDPYNVYGIANQKWRYIGETSSTSSKL